tara:strand:+ start:5234 stop:6205 length:972 start_codon:yes stop_codon:yes gene_type:complete
MNKIEKLVLSTTKAKSLHKVEVIQGLWSGYGEIVRYALTDSQIKNVVVKQVQLSSSGNHPRGWGTGLSHLRKVKSYEVEMAWYKLYSHRCDDYCRVPHCFEFEKVEGNVILVLEDLDDAGYAGRKTAVGLFEMEMCLSWLANFHATFMYESPLELWDVGTYWHLATRTEELEVLKDVSLKNIAQDIDDRLSESSFLTFVHGDAKLANFCFSDDDNSVAAVDFQYVGGGCGMKDVAYFIGSCLDSNQCSENENRLLNFYFRKLKNALQSKKMKIDTDKLEKDWRDLYPFACADFDRFLKGWSPKHSKINSYTERITQDIINQLK